MPGPAYEAVLLHRADLLQRWPKAWAALQSLEGKITAARMIEMNAAAELEGRVFAQIAAEFLHGGSPSRAASRDRRWRQLKVPFWTMLKSRDRMLKRVQVLK
ncbi:MAG: glycine betaine ABC transporter substrate-binding protein [Chromatiales bacterium]